MTLKVDLRLFLDEAGNKTELTDQAKIVFKFLTKIVSAVTGNIDQALIEVDLKCNSRAEELSCVGEIEATHVSIGIIEWYCDSCEASGTISNWQDSQWDKQKRILH